MPRLDYRNAKTCWASGVSASLTSVGAQCCCQTVTPILSVRARHTNALGPSLAGCSLTSALISSWPCSSTDVCTGWRHSICPSTSSVLPIPIVAVSGRRHPLRLAASDTTYTAFHCWQLCVSVGLRNNLPCNVTSAPMLAVFWKRLKSRLFSRSFPS